MRRWHGEERRRTNKNPPIPRERVVLGAASNAEAINWPTAGATLSEKAESFVIAATDSAAGVGANLRPSSSTAATRTGMYGCLELRTLDMTVWRRCASPNRSRARPYGISRHPPVSPLAYETKPLIHGGFYP
jgi:hypothetical protein